MSLTARPAACLASGGRVQLAAQLYQLGSTYGYSGEDKSGLGSAVSLRHPLALSEHYLIHIHTSKTAGTLTAWEGSGEMGLTLATRR